MTVLKYNDGAIIKGRPFTWGDGCVWYMKTGLGIVDLHQGDPAGYSEKEILNYNKFRYATQMEIK